MDDNKRKEEIDWKLEVCFVVIGNGGLGICSVQVLDIYQDRVSVN